MFWQYGNTMELLFIAILLVLFLLPSILIGRKQRQRQREVQQFQRELVPGQRVITAGGIVGTVVAARNNTVDLELSPNVVVTFERMGIIRSADAITAADDAALENQQPNTGAAAQPEAFDDRDSHPENYSSNYGPGNYDAEDTDEGDFGGSSEPKN